MNWYALSDNIGIIAGERRAISRRDGLDGVSSGILVDRAVLRTDLKQLDHRAESRFGVKVRVTPVIATLREADTQTVKLFDPIPHTADRECDVLHTLTSFHQVI